MSMLQEDAAYSKKAYVTTLLKNTIQSVNGDVNPMTIARFINSMKLGDSMAFRTFLNRNEPTMLATIPYVCEACQYQQEYNLPKDQQIFGISPENKNDIILEPHFLMTYFAGFT